MPKAKKDPNAPKRGKSAFMFFSIAERPKLVKEKPGLPFGEYGKLLGASWREMSDEDKAPYQEQAVEDKERYQREKAAYEAKCAEESQSYDSYPNYPNY